MKRGLVVAGCIGALLVAMVVVFQLVRSQQTDQDLSQILNRVTAQVPDSWVERKRATAGGSGVLSASSRRTASVTYEGSGSSAEFERILNAAGARIERCEENSFITQCYGVLESRRVGVSVDNGMVTVTVAESP